MRPKALARRASLLESLQELLERTYRMDTGVREIGRFVIGDEGYMRLYVESGRERSEAGAGTRLHPALHAEGIGTRLSAAAHAGGGTGRSAAHTGEGTIVSAAAHAGGGARVLVRDGPDGVAARIYYPDVLIEALEAHPPTRGLGEPNVDAFATFIEELDHFLLIAERARSQRPVSLLELELHANVTKYLVCALFLARGRSGEDGGDAALENRIWLRWHLFEKAEFREPDPEVQARYRDASRFARRFLDRLDTEPSATARLARLRAFHDSSHQQKLQSLD